MWIGHLAGPWSKKTTNQSSWENRHRSSLFSFSGTCYGSSVAAGPNTIGKHRLKISISGHRAKWKRGRMGLDGKHLVQVCFD